MGERRKDPPLELCIGIVLVVLMSLELRCIASANFGLWPPKKEDFISKSTIFSRGQLLVFRECSCDPIS